MSRRIARELALQTLYQIDMVGGEPGRALDYLIEEMEEERSIPPGTRGFALELVEGTLARRAEVDAEISAYARDWRLERLAAVDRNVLRLAIYQMLFRADIPVSAAINEAVDLAKAYGDAESGRFVNGVLGQLSRDRRSAGMTGDAPGEEGLSVAAEGEGTDDRETDG